METYFASAPVPLNSGWMGPDTVEKGYRIQFQNRAPRFSGITHTLVSPDQEQMMEHEVQSLPTIGNPGHAAVTS